MLCYDDMLCIEILSLLRAAELVTDMPALFLCYALLSSFIF